MTAFEDQTPAGPNCCQGKLTCAPTGRPSRLLLGIGNILMGDDGIGVHVARALAPESDELGVTVEDGGTGGISLLDLFEAYDEILVIDAAGIGRRPGDVEAVRPEMICARRAWSGHDHGLVDVLRLMEVFPAGRTIRILGVQPARIFPSTDLSPEMRVAFPQILAAVRIEASRVWEQKGVSVP